MCGRGWLCVCGWVVVCVWVGVGNFRAIYYVLMFIWVMGYFVLMYVRMLSYLYIFICLYVLWFWFVIISRGAEFCGLSI